jgi:chaperone BCS1
MIQALAGKFGRNLCYLSPTHPELSDDSLKSAIERVPDNAFVVLEDVDALFGKNREKKVQQSPLTFSGLLNALDGVGNHEGLVFVLTTNFKDQLDPALIRDGRVDMRVRFDYCTPSQMEKMFENFYPLVRMQMEGGSEPTGESNPDPEIAALESKLAALKRSKVAATQDGTSSEAVPPSGAVFRDALLLSLGERGVSAAQLQHFFVTHRKCTPAEAIADVGAIVIAMDDRLKEEAEKDSNAPKDESPEQKGPQTTPAITEPAKANANGKVVHVHVHAAES